MSTAALTTWITIADLAPLLLGLVLAAAVATVLLAVAALGARRSRPARRSASARVADVRA